MVTRLHRGTLVVAVLPAAFVGGLLLAAAGGTLPVLLGAGATLLGGPGTPEAAARSVGVLVLMGAVSTSYATGLVLGPVAVALGFLAGVLLISSAAAGLTLLAVAVVYGSLAVTVPPERRDGVVALIRDSYS